MDFMTVFGFLDGPGTRIHIPNTPVYIEERHPGGDVTVYNDDEWDGYGYKMSVTKTLVLSMVNRAKQYCQQYPEIDSWVVECLDAFQRKL